MRILLLIVLIVLTLTFGNASSADPVLITKEIPISTTCEDELGETAVAHSTLWDIKTELESCLKKLTQTCKEKLFDELGVFLTLLIAEEKLFLLQKQFFQKVYLCAY